MPFVPHFLWRLFEFLPPSISFHEDLLVSRNRVEDKVSLCPLMLSSSFLSNVVWWETMACTWDDYLYTSSVKWNRQEDGEGPNHETPPPYYRYLSTPLLTCLERFRTKCGKTYLSGNPPEGCFPKPLLNCLFGKTRESLWGKTQEWRPTQTLELFPVPGRTRRTNGQANL